MRSLRLLLVASLLSTAATALAEDRRGGRGGGEVESGGRADASFVTLGLGVGPAVALGNAGTGVLNTSTVMLAPSVLFKLPLKAKIGFHLGLIAGLEFSKTANNQKTDVFLLDLLPTLRIDGQPIPKLRIYGDASVGFVVGSLSNSFGSVTVSQGITGLGVRVAAGVAYEVLEGLSVFFEPIGLQFKNLNAATTFGNTTFNSALSSTQYSLMLGIQARF